MQLRTSQLCRSLNGLIVASCIALLGAGNALAQPVRGLALVALFQEENTRSSLPEEEENASKTEDLSSHRAARRASRKRARPQPRSHAEPGGSRLPLDADFVQVSASAPGALACARGCSINPALRL